MKKHSPRAEAFIEGYNTGVRHMEKEFYDWLNNPDCIDITQKLEELEERLKEDG